MKKHKIVVIKKKPRGATATKTANRALQEVRKLKVAAGNHFIDIGSNDFFVSQGTEVFQAATNLTNIAEGVGIDQRVGNQINLKSLLLDGAMSANGVAAGTSQTMHIALVQDTRQVGDQAPAYTDVFETSTVRANHGLRDRFMNSDVQPGRFKVLWQSVITVVQGQANTTKQVRKYFRWKKPFKVAYNGTLGTDIDLNGIYILGKHDNVADAFAPDFAFKVRVRYDP